MPDISGAKDRISISQPSKHTHLDSAQERFMHTPTLSWNQLEGSGPRAWKLNSGSDFSTLEAVSITASCRRTSNKQQSHMPWHSNESAQRRGHLEAPNTTAGQSDTPVLRARDMADIR